MDQRRLSSTQRLSFTTGASASSVNEAGECGRISDHYDERVDFGNVELSRARAPAQRRVSSFVPPPPEPQTTQNPMHSISERTRTLIHGEGRSDKMPDPPDAISIELWRKVKERAEASHNASGHGKKERDPAKVLNDIAEFANDFQPPTGFGDPELWKVIVEGTKASMTEEQRLEHNAICKNIHARFLDAERHAKAAPFCSSRVVNFFLDYNSTDFNVDSAVNAFALVNALILTIPFGIITSLDHEWIAALKEAVRACPDDSTAMKYMSGYTLITTGNDLFTKVYTDLVTRLSGSVYFSMMGLILSTLYYIFSPSDKSVLTINGSIRQRILIVIEFCFLLHCQ